MKYAYFFFALIAIYLGFRVFNPWEADAPETTAHSSHGSRTQTLPDSSFVDSSKPLNSRERGAVIKDSENVVIIDSGRNQMDAIDVIERLQTLKNSKDDEDLEFVRWAMNSSDYSSEDKIKIFSESTQILSSGDMNILCSEILKRGDPAELLETSLALRTKNLNQLEMKDVLQRIWNTTKNNNTRVLIKDFASQANVSIDE